MDLINSQFHETSILETIDRNSLKSLDFHEVINKNDFETEDAANEFYLAFAWYLYIVAIDNDIRPLFEDKLEGDLSVLWFSVLTTLTELDADAPDWAQLPCFLKTFKALKTNKEQKKEESSSTKN